jgi:hypothetical protein
MTKKEIVKLAHSYLETREGDFSNTVAEILEEVQDSAQNGSTGLMFLLDEDTSLDTVEKIKEELVTLGFTLKIFDEKHLDKINFGLDITW